MNARQEFRFKMFLTLKNYLLSNPAITAKLPHYDEFMVALDAAILEINSNTEKYLFNSKGITGNKKQDKANLIITTMDASRKMQAYAHYIGDLVLMSEIRLTESKLNQLSEIDMLNTATGLHSRIESNLTKVEPYSLTPETQTKFWNDITTYKDVIPVTRQNQLSKKENILLIANAYAQADIAVSNLTSIVDIVRTSEPIFHAGYKNARKIIEFGINTLQVQGYITDATTLQTIVDATISFRLSGDPKVVIEKQTAAKGGFNIKSLSEGIYDVTISKIGYQSQTISATVSFTDLCDVSVAMQKI